MSTTRGRLYFPLLVLFITATLAFTWLGTWQVQRRAWKLDLIARVDARIHAPAAPTPGPELWPTISEADDEYRHVSAQGVFLHDKNALVQASTAIGTGYWILTPLQLADGNLVLINRGLLPEGAPPTQTPGDPQIITGLLRLSEPGGRTLRHNDPAARRWYSRDVTAIAATLGLDARHVAPYFIDADAAPTHLPGTPVAGLTVVSFYNHHLVYIFTWYTLALMSAAAALYLLRQGRR